MSTQSDAPASGTADNGSEAATNGKEKKKSGGVGAALKKGIKKFTKSKSIEESTTAGMVAAAGMQVTNTLTI